MNSKTLSFAILLSFTLPGALRAADQTLDPQSEYSKAVKAYVDAAGVQLQAVRDNLGALTKSATGEAKERYQKASETLEQTEKVLSRLKTTTAMDFDRVKAEFERSREKLLKELSDAQKS
jgi:hypothetical protein